MGANFFFFTDHVTSVRKNWTGACKAASGAGECGDREDVPLYESGKRLPGLSSVVGAQKSLFARRFVRVPGQRGHCMVGCLRRSLRTSRWESDSDVGSLVHKSERTRNSEHWLGT